MTVTFDTIAGAWNSFFHTPESPATISLFRIFFGLLLTCNAALLLREATLWFGPTGIYSIDYYNKSWRKSYFSLFSYLPATDFAVYFVLWLHLAAAVLLTVGFLTPVCALLVFITLVSIHHRNPTINHSGDSVLRLMTFLLIFSFAGRQFSVDSVLFESPLYAGTSVSPWCVRVMQLQLSILYFHAFAAKLSGRAWRNGTAAYSLHG